MATSQTSEVIQYLRRAVLLCEGAALTDGQLLGSFVEQRDDAAFAALVRRHGPMVWGVCRRLLDQHDAEDAFQATFIVLVRKAVSIVPRERVANWLYGVAHQTALQARRNAARRRAKEKQVAQMPEPVAVERDLWPDLQPVLDQELSRLPDTYREVIVLSDLEGKTRREVARQLGLPEGTVASRLARARNMLAKRLTQRGVALSSGTLAAILSREAASAAVPPLVVSSTIEAATFVAAGEAASMGAISVKVAALTTGVIKAMLMSKLQKVMTVLLLVAVAGTVAANLYQTRATEPPRERQPGEKPPALKTAQGGKHRPARPSRADRMKTIRDEYSKARDDFSKAIQAGKIKPTADDKYPGWEELLERYARPARKLIDEDPSDSVACDAVVFCIHELASGGYAPDPALYRIAREHHAASEKIEPALGSAPVDLLRAIVAKSPHAKIRSWANYHLAEKLYTAGKPDEARSLLKTLRDDAQAKEIGGYTMGSLADTASRLLFAITRLEVGQEVPEISGKDLDGKDLKLSASRGKVTLLVFWATWCAPCMAMVPHERALVKRYTGKPFVLLGVNGDLLADEDFKVTGPDGKVRDDSARVKAALKKHEITWRSFRNGQFGAGLAWNVRSWPTIYLIDHRGIIRGKWKGDPGEKVLDAAVEKFVKIAQADEEKADK
jgi:RNA polymerase sigma factor (sigma-70 family)